MPAEPKPQQQQQPRPSDQPRSERPQERAPGLKEGSVVTEASDDSFPASDPPAWTSTAGAGAPPAGEEPPKERTEP